MRKLELSNLVSETKILRFENPEATEYRMKRYYAWTVYTCEHNSISGSDLTFAVAAGKAQDAERDLRENPCQICAQQKKP